MGHTTRRALLEPQFPFRLQVCNNLRVSQTRADELLGVGSKVEVYGHQGPAFGSFAVTLDGQTTEHTAFNRVNYTNSTVLFSTDQLAYDRHTLTLTNLGPKTPEEGNTFLLDFVKWWFEAVEAGRASLYA